MKAIVLYESMYGNTRHIAEAIGRGLEGCGEVVVSNVNQVDQVRLAEADLVIIGGPTHVHGMSWPASRDNARADKVAARALESSTAGDGVREWLKALQPAGQLFCSFDTRVEMPRWITGSASSSIQHVLAHKGVTEVAAPASFLVTDNNELKAGECERARAWGLSTGRRAAVVVAERVGVSMHV